MKKYFATAAACILFLSCLFSPVYGREISWAVDQVRLDGFIEETKEENSGEKAAISANSGQIDSAQADSGSIDSAQADSVQTDGDAADLALTAPSAILMEVSTGSVIYEKEGDIRLSPASITKIMTLILIFDALENGQIQLTDSVTTSAYAKSMGGSQVFLEEGEIQTVETLIKCIVVASGNDASVAMAEYIAGSEAEFVNRMNARAAGLGMNNTHFEDCCGLSDSDNHYSSARDVGIMSCELLRHYPQVTEYSTIWMENITHTTAQGSKEFCLSNTNKLLKQYPWTTGLKTGSTSKAKYCLSASALKDGISLVAVIMACPNYKQRFPEAQQLLQYGYGKVSLYQDQPTETNLVAVDFGEKEMLPIYCDGGFSYLSLEKRDFSQVRKEWSIPEIVQAPITKGQEIGSLIYYLGEEEIGRISVIAGEDIGSADFFDCMNKFFREFFYGA